MKNQSSLVRKHTWRSSRKTESNGERKNTGAAGLSVRWQHHQEHLQNKGTTTGEVHEQPDQNQIKA
jgi:hypothetical protein